MGAGMVSVCIYFWLLLISLSHNNTAKDVCTNQIFLNSPENSKIYTKLSSFKDCEEINFEGSEKQNSHLSSLKLAAISQRDEISLNVSFHNIKWKKAYLKLLEENKPETSICKIYSTDIHSHLLPSEVFDQCFNLNTYNKSVNYVLEFKADLQTDILYKKFVFSLPTLETFGNTIPLQKRSIFSNIDASSSYEIILKIQALPPSYNVTYYKVEVFKEKDNKDILLDVRMLDAANKDELSFDYLTYNEEGHYFFKVSAISDECLEDLCLKTITPKIYIKRKYTPLVIGIVGASFFIPFVLFILHMWTRRNQLQDDTGDQKDTVFLVYNQTPEKHYLIVKALEKSLKSLSKVQLVTKISEASHILYICGTHIFEPDPVTHKYLVIEANKAISEVEIMVISFPYSTKEIPPYLKKCLNFELMEDFSKFIYVFNCDADFEHNAQYLDLSVKVKAAQIHTEPKKIILNMPVIIVTEQSDSDNEPKEGDVLL